LGTDVGGMWIPELFRMGLELFARGPVRYHFASVDETVAELRAAGFRDAHLYRPTELVPAGRAEGGPAHLVRIVTAVR
jgi:hypothetical protein